VSLVAARAPPTATPAVRPGRASIAVPKELRAVRRVIDGRKVAW
jgi:hypothetical protein